jgi:translation initiation factor 2B subunit (eIF-2B alpha/beta/delta family)
VARLERTFQSQKRSINEMEGELHTLRDSLSEANPKAGVLDALEERLAEAKGNEAAFARAYGDSVTAKDSLDSQQAETKKEIDAINRAIEAVVTKLQEAESAAKLQDEAKQQKLLDKNRAGPKVRLAENDHAEQQASLDAAEKEAKAASAEAEKVGTRMTLPRNETYSSLEKKRSRLIRDLAEAQKQ